jgi:hypothetical protein
MFNKMHNGVRITVYDALSVGQKLADWQIPAIARADAFADIEKHGLAYAYGNVECAKVSLGSALFETSTTFAYAAAYEQVVLGYFMAMGL